MNLEDEIQLAKSYYDLIDDEIIFVLKVVENRFVFLALNECYERVVGLRHSDVRGKSPDECLPRETAIKVNARYRDCVSKRETISYFEHLLINGKYTSWHTKLSPKVVDGEVVLILGKAIEATEVVTTELMIEEALEKQDFQIQYQPIVDLASLNVISQEALLRWPVTDISPAKFIPIAKRCGLIQALSTYVFRAVARDIYEFKPKPPIGINVSHFPFWEEAKDIFEGYQVPMNLVYFEVTEDVHIGGQIATEIFLARSQGASVRLDDVGTMYNGLLQIMEMGQCDGLKIDIAFVRDCHQSPQKQAVCELIVNLAQRVGIPSVVAEGIQEEAEAEYLRSIGVGYGQGYLFRKPGELIV